MSRNTLSHDDVEFIKNALRQASIKWPGRHAALKRARKKVREGTTKLGKPVYKYYWQCANCTKWFRDEKEMEVDHVVEIGSFEEDWNPFLARMFPQIESALQVLCVLCHLKKTKKFNAAHLKYTRKR